MPRPKGSKNKMTLYREAKAFEMSENRKVREADTAARAAAELQTTNDAIVMRDCLELIDEGARYFYFCFLTEKKKGEKADRKVMREAMFDAIKCARYVAPFRHPTLSRVKLAGDAESPLIPEGTTAAELLSGILKDLARMGLSRDQIVELAARPIVDVTPNGVANRKSETTGQS